VIPVAVVFGPICKWVRYMRSIKKFQNSEKERKKNRKKNKNTKKNYLLVFEMCVSSRAGVEVIVVPFGLSLGAASCCSRRRRIPSAT
jgi:hypothetical protein